MSNSFADAMVNFSNTTLTANGCPTYKSSLNANLDMFGQMSAMRRQVISGDTNKVLDIFSSAYNEDKDLAIRNLFYLRDIRGGQGERDIFKTIVTDFLYDSDMTEEQFKRFIKYIPEYGRWDDVFEILGHFINNKKVNKKRYLSLVGLINEQLMEDMRNMRAGKPISLMAKWFPIANNTRNREKKFLAITLSKAFFSSEKACRNAIVSLRKYSNVLEQKISANKWESIDYSTVPARAGMKYVKAFYRHDEGRYSEFLSSVKNGEAKINTGTLYPYDITNKVIKNCIHSSMFSYFNEPMASNEEMEAYETMWNNLPDYTNGNSAICVVDVSGSMTYGYGSTVTPISVATSLGLYFAERNKSAFKDMFFTFESNPSIVRVEGNSLKEKLENMLKAPWGGSTNLEATFDLYINLAKKSNPEDLPKSLIIISDMEFNDCIENPNGFNTLFENAKKKFSEANIPMPNLCFWNVEASGSNVPVRYDEYGTILVSGASPTIFKMTMEGQTPESFMKSVLYSERYNVKVF